MLFVDIAVPRNVDPTIASLENVFLCDIDGLQGIVASHGREAANAVESAGRMIDGAVDAFCKTADTREIGPLIPTMTNRMESIGAAELEKHIGKLSSASPEDRHHLEVMVKRITRKILHPLIIYMKRHGESPSETTDYVEVLAAAFGANAWDGSAGSLDNMRNNAGVQQALSKQMPGVPPYWRDLPALALATDRTPGAGNFIRHQSLNAQAD